MSLAFLSVFMFAFFADANMSLAETAVPGHAVLARPDGAALIIWDASRVVAMVVRSTMSDRAANHLLELDSIKVLARMLPLIDSRASSATVRVVYSLTGAVSPVYGTVTFAGVEHYSALTADAKSLANWKKMHTPESIFPWFRYIVLGKLPPRTAGTAFPSH
ncbi:MAG: hypothetical protein DLM50_08815 [Candidatus Meridianibacter frigidus]|nr:MAG: hypothetical protein DLM50_08815 [Candidatus Eremiobacteraeota bacterium]